MSETEFTQEQALRLLAAIEFVGDPLSGRPVPQWALDCDDCPMDPHHRWNCAQTPIWAQTIRDLDTNPWTVVVAKLPIPGWPAFAWNGDVGTAVSICPCVIGQSPCVCGDTAVAELHQLLDQIHRQHWSVFDRNEWCWIYTGKSWDEYSKQLAAQRRHEAERRLI